MLPTDAALPQLALALDARAMGEVFAAELAQWQVQRCEIDRIKYRPGRSCTVAYRLQLHDARHGHTIEQRVAARFCSGGDAARRLHLAQDRAATASAAGPVLTHRAALDMLAHWWPNDFKLDAPRLLHDADALRRQSLDEVVAALSGGRGRLIDQRTTIVQAVPELRVCARVELRFQTEPGGATRTQVLYAKADLERDGARAHAIMRALADSAAQAGGRLRTPRPLLWQPSTGLHWQLALPGRVLDDVESPIGVATSASVGHQLAALHATPVPALGEADAEPLQARLARSCELLERVEPGWRHVVQRLSRRLGHGAQALAAQPAVTLHGDLHARNILVSESGLAFIDLDSAWRGPAVLELGGWVADLLYRAVLDGLPSVRMAAAVRAFVSAYAQSSGQPVDAEQLALSTAYDLLCKRACRCVANLKPGRFEAVPQLLALADRIAGGGSVDAVLMKSLEAA